MITKQQIEQMTHEEVHQRCKEKQRQCKTVAQYVEMITSDTEMLLLIDRIASDLQKRYKKGEQQ